MDALSKESASYFVELREYPIEEVSVRLRASEADVREAMAGLVLQGLASSRSCPNLASNKPSTLITFSFVGVAAYNDVVIRCLPKFFDQEECTEDALEQVIRAIFQQRSSDLSPHSQHDENLDSMQGAMDEAVFFVADYLQNGEYPATPVVRESDEMGDIDWSRTIDERNPWMLGESLVYLDPVYTYTETDNSDLCQQLHIAIVSDCFRFLKSTGIAEVIGIGAWPPSDSKLSDFGSPAYILERLRSEKQIQFDDRRLQLLDLMEKHLERSMSLRSYEYFGFFGTTHFEVVWETLCATAFSNHRDTPISKCIPNAKLPERSAHLTTNSTLKDLIEKPVWYVSDRESSFTQESAGKLNPDVITVHHENGTCLAILDAKYYALRIEGHSASNLPGVEDIVKQHAYQMALQPFATVNGLLMQNALLFPTGGETRIVGKVHYEVLSYFAGKKLLPISIVLVNMGDVIDYYLAGTPSWLETSRAIFRQL